MSADMDVNTVTKIGRLARIALTEEEKPSIARELSGIFRWIEQLQGVNTEGVPQLSSVAGVALPWREDAVTDGNQAAAVLANAPAAAHGCFEVPKVVE